MLFITSSESFSSLNLICPAWILVNSSAVRNPLRLIHTLRLLLDLVVSAYFPSIRTLYTTNVISALNPRPFAALLTRPAPAFLGLLKGSPPASCRACDAFSNWSPMNSTSPRTSNSETLEELPVVETCEASVLMSILAGMKLMNSPVDSGSDRYVQSSPVVPLPLVEMSVRSPSES